MLREALLLLATLRLFMHGRIIAPALVSHAQSQGRTLRARVRPRLEGCVRLCLLLLLLLAPLPRPLAVSAASLLLIGTGGLTLLRW